MSNQDPESYQFKSYAAQSKQKSSLYGQPNAGTSVPNQSSGNVGCHGGSIPRDIINKENRRSSSGKSRAPPTPISREAYVRIKYGTMRNFMTRYGLKWENKADRMEAEAMIDSMRGDRDHHADLMINRAGRQRAKSESLKNTGYTSERYGHQSPPPSARRMSASISRDDREELLFPMEEEMHVETPAQRRAIRDEDFPMTPSSSTPKPRKPDPVQDRYAARTKALLERVEEDDDDEDDPYDDTMRFDYDGTHHYDHGYDQEYDCASGDYW